MILAPIVVAALLLDHYGPVYVLLCLASIICLIEFFRITSPALPLSARTLLYLLSTALFWLLYLGEIHLLPLVVISWFCLPIMYFVLFDPRPAPKKVEALAMGILGPVYICMPLGMLGMIVRYPGGNIWILFLLVVVFSGDTGAFYLGRWLGKRRLHPTISPGKTWEGAAGSVIFSLIAGSWFVHLMGLERIRPLVFLLIILLSIIAQLGDLSESFIKRSYQVKDSGGLLPGHGGLLDRIDGVLFAAPLLYLYLIIKTAG